MTVKLVMRYCLLVILSLMLRNVFAEQYQSRELLVQPQASSEFEQKSINELEEGLAANSNSYSKSSTSRYLARHYLQSANFQKAENYYLQAIEGDGLSDYAKQDVLLELARLYIKMKAYSKLIKSLKQRELLGGKPNSATMLMQALGDYHLGNKAKAIASTDAAWAEEKYPDLPFLKQLLYLYFNTSSYTKAGDVQKAIIAKSPNDIAQWRHLSAIYLKQGKVVKAANALSVAKQKNLPLLASDIHLLADLLAKSRNPYAAARVLAEALKNEKLDNNLAVRTKLFRYWLLAKERDKAVKVLEQTLQRYPSVEGFLELAHLQVELQQWPNVKGNVEAACHLGLPDGLVSKANVLLGISELKQGFLAQARAAFINATLIGGESSTALSYLDYMGQSVSDDDGLIFNGDCTPLWAKTKAKQFLLDLPKASANDEFFNDDVSEDFGVVDDIDYQIKYSKKTTLVAHDYSIPLVELENKIAPKAIQLGMFIAKHGGLINGNMHFILPKPLRIGDEIMNFKMAFPVSRKPSIRGRHHIFVDEGFKSASMIFEGSAEQLLPTWVKLTSKVLADGLTLSGESRQIVLDARRASKKQLKLELQLGIE